MSDESKILLVEDEANIAKLFQYNFKKAGYVCEVAGNGVEALEKLKEYKPDLIVSDIMMPLMNGFEFRQRLIDNSEYNQIPFVFLTAKGEDDDILEGYELDIEDYIIKTATPKVVIAKINALIKGKKKERSKTVEEVSKAAGSLGAKVVPASVPEFENYYIKHWHVPFEDTPGGDFIDYLKVDDDNMVVVLGDVMGKKWGAWYFAVAYAGYVRSATRFAVESTNKLCAGEILKAVNKSIYKDERLSEIFVTLSVIVLNRKENKVFYSGAGDLPIFLKKGDTVTMVKSDGLLIGFNEDGEYIDQEIDLDVNDAIYLISDGIIESRNPEIGEPFGKDKLIFVLEKTPVDSDPIEKIKREFTNYTNGKFEDDVSLLCIKRI